MFCILSNCILSNEYYQHEHLAREKAREFWRIKKVIKVYIHFRQEDKEMQLKAAEAHLKLGEVSMESGN